MAKKIYGEDLSRQEQTKADSYILQDEYKSDKWDHIKVYPFKTEDIKSEQIVNTKQNSKRGEYVKDIHKTIKTVF